MPNTTQNDARDANLPPANDNPQPNSQAISFSDLALALDVDEDALLQRLAEILSKRDVGRPDAPDDRAPATSVASAP